MDKDFYSKMTIVVWLEAVQESMSELSDESRKKVMELLANPNKESFRKIENLFIDEDLSDSFYRNLFELARKTKKEYQSVI